MKIPKLFLDATKTLESFNMSADEFYSQLVIGAKCSGLNMYNCSCEGIRCTKCPVSDQKSADDIRTWLSGVKPKTIDRIISVEERITNLELGMVEVLDILRTAYKIKEIT